MWSQAGATSTCTVARTHQHDSNLARPLLHKGPRGAARGVQTRRLQVGGHLRRGDVDDEHHMAHSAVPMCRNAGSAAPSASTATAGSLTGERAGPHRKSAMRPAESSSVQTRRCSTLMRTIMSAMARRWPAPAASVACTNRIRARLGRQHRDLATHKQGSPGLEGAAVGAGQGFSRNVGEHCPDQPECLPEGHVWQVGVRYRAADAG